MSSSIRSKRMAALEEEQLKLKLEQYRSSNRPAKSILKPSGNATVASSVSHKFVCAGALKDPHMASHITPKARASHGSSSTSSCEPGESSVAAEERHIRVLLQKVMTDVNSLANTCKIEEVIDTFCP